MVVDARDIDYSIESYEAVLRKVKFEYGDALRVTFPYKLEFNLYASIVHHTAGFILSGFTRKREEIIKDLEKALEGEYNRSFN